MIKPKFIYIHRITVVDKIRNIKFKGDEVHYESRIIFYYVFRTARARVNNYYYVNTLL